MTLHSQPTPSGSGGTGAPETPPVIGTCAYPGCTRQLVPSRRWCALPPSERRRLRGQGYYRYASRGLCDPCRYLAVRDGTLADFPRRTVSRDEVLEDWAHLDHDPTQTRKRQIALAAPHLGMTATALEKALERAAQQGVVV